MVPPPGAVGQSAAPRWASPVVLGAAAVGILLRVAMGFESFWLDEAWSWQMAQQASSVGDIFSTFAHDNNHPLNTLYLYAVRDVAAGAHWIVLRLPSLLAGSLSLFVLAHLAAAWGRRATDMLVLLVATSFPLVVASAQARGYAMAILLSLVYVAVTRSAVGRRARFSALALPPLAAAGLLAHPTFVYPLAGAMAWTGARSLAAGEGAWGALRRVLWLHGAPLTLAALAYLAFYGHVEIGGGSVYDRWVTLRQAVAQTMGLPRRGPLTWVASGVALALSAQGLWTLWRRRELPMLCFFGVTLALAPALVILVSDPKLLYARYLLTTFPWFYLLAVIGLAALWERGRARGALRVGVAVVVAFFVASNGLQVGRVLSEGRDDYLETLRFIDARSVGDRIEIGSDHDFRNLTLLRFYGPRIPSGRPIVYLPRDRWPPGGPEWLLRHDWKAGHDPETFYEPLPGLGYERVQSFEHGPGDGFQWFVYRRAR